MLTITDTHKEFLEFLKKVEEETDMNKDLHIVVDNYATHKHLKVRNWLKRNKRVTLYFIPTSSSWLNLVERFFSVLTEKQLKRGVFTSVAELEQKIVEYIDRHNENPKPFVWTKSAEDILGKVSRARSALYNKASIEDATLDHCVLKVLFLIEIRTSVNQLIAKVLE